MSVRGRFEMSPIGNTERAFHFRIYSKLSIRFLPLLSRFWEFWANHFELRLQLNDVQVHKTHCAKVTKRTALRSKK